jgi:hypothetical protein
LALCIYFPWRLAGDETSYVPILECTILRLDDNLAFHAFVSKTAGMATLKRICARRLRQELNHGRFSLLELPTVLRRSKN